MMKGQLIKDMYISKNDIIISLIVCLCLFLISIGLKIIDHDTYGAYPVQIIMLQVMAFISPVIAANSMFNDEKCGYMNNAFTAPVSRKDYLKGKYIFSILLTVFFFAVMCVFVLGVLAFSKEGITAEGLSKTGVSVVAFLGFSILAVTYIVSVSIAAGAKSAVMSFVILGIYPALRLTVFVLGFSNAAGVKSAVKYLINNGTANASFFGISDITIFAAGIALELFLLFMGFKWAERKEA